MRALLVGDVHLADRPPANCTPSYLWDLQMLLGEVIRAAGEQEVDHVIFAGDWFHLKAPSRVSHALVQWSTAYFEDLAKVAKPWIVPGNHDMSHDRLDLWGQPLETVFRAGVVGRGVGEFIPGVLGIPWLADWADLPLWLDGRWLENDPHLIVAHAPIYHQATPFESINPLAFVRPWPRPATVFYGHVHDVVGIKSVSGWQFVNHGALTRGSLSAADIRDEVMVTVYDAPSADGGLGVVTPVSLPCRPASEVLRVMEANDRKVAQAEVDRLLDSIETAGLAKSDADTILAELVDNPLVTGNVRALLAELLESVS